MAAYRGLDDGGRDPFRYVVGQIVEVDRVTENGDLWGRFVVDVED